MPLRNESTSNWFHGTPAVGLDATVAAEHVGQGLLEFGAADRVELDVGVMHPGLVVDPLADLGRGSLSFEFCGFGVGPAALVALGGEEPDQVPAPGQELLDPFPTCRGQQCGLFGDELGTDLVIQPDQHRGDGVDMPARDLTRRPTPLRTSASHHRPGPVC